MVKFINIFVYEDLLFMNLLSAPYIINFYQVISGNVIVQDSSGKEIESQLLPIANASIAIRNYYTAAYVGKSPSVTPKYWLAFIASVPPLGFSTYVISSTKGAG